MRSANTFILGSLFLTGGVFLGTFAARLSTPTPAPISSFVVSSEHTIIPRTALVPTKKTTKLAGLLLDEAGAPISGATLALSSQQTTSDATGRFLFPQLEEGLVSLRIHHPDYLTHQSDAMQAVPGNDLETTITLQRPRRVRVHITNKQGKPLAAVELTSPEHEPTITDSKGFAQLELAPEKTSPTRVMLGGFQPLLLLLGDEESIELKLQRPSALIGELLDAPKGTQLMLLPMHEGNLTTASYLVNASPLFSFQGLLPGPYQLWAKHQGRTWQLQELSLKEGETHVRLPFIAAPLSPGEACDEGFTPTVSVERQEGSLVVQKAAHELLAGDRIISIDGVSLGDENSFLASWAGARGSVARLVVERPASKRFLFLMLARTTEISCPNEAK